LDIVIFYCANTTVFPMSDWKFSEGVNKLNWATKWSLLEKCWKTTDFRHTFRGYVYGL